MHTKSVRKQNKTLISESQITIMKKWGGEGDIEKNIDIYHITHTHENEKYIYYETNP